MTDTELHDLEIAVVALEHFKDVQYREVSQPAIQGVIDRFRARITAQEVEVEP